MGPRLASGLARAGTLALSGCFRLSPPGEAPGPAIPAPPPAVIESAAMAGVVSGPGVEALNFTPGDAGSALASFLDSCPQLIVREDVSGLTHGDDRSEEHTSELQSLMRISYAVFCVKKKRTTSIERHT